jgi:predicted DsbA family dithiol-disulfide isomerase
LGKARLERAIKLYQSTYPEGKDDTFSIQWQPFYLDPTLPKVSVPVVERMAQRFGRDRLEMMHARMTQMGKAEGINFTFKGWVGNTRDSHRLIELGRTKGTETENKVVSAVMKNYFEEGGDITSIDQLVAAGEKAGIPKSEVRSWLEEGKGGDEVDRKVEEAYRKGISGVPFFEIQGKWRISGAQDVEDFVEQFVAAKAATAGSKTVGVDNPATCARP